MALNVETETTGAVC